MNNREKLAKWLTAMLMMERFEPRGEKEVTRRIREIIAYAFVGGILNFMFGMRKHSNRIHKEGQTDINNFTDTIGNLSRKQPISALFKALTHIDNRNEEYKAFKRHREAFTAFELVEEINDPNINQILMDGAHELATARKRIPGAVQSKMKTGMGKEDETEIALREVKGRVEQYIKTLNENQLKNFANKVEDFVAEFWGKP